MCIWTPLYKGLKGTIFLLCTVVKVAYTLSAPQGRVETWATWYKQNFAPEGAVSWDAGLRAVCGGLAVVSSLESNRDWESKAGGSE